MTQSGTLGCLAGKVVPSKQTQSSKFPLSQSSKFPLSLPYKTANFLHEIKLSLVTSCTGVWKLYCIGILYSIIFLLKLIHSPTLDWTFSLKHVGVHNLHRSMENAQAHAGTAQCVGQGDTVDSQLLAPTAHRTLQPIITELEWQILAFHCCQKSSETPSAPYVPLCD